MAWINFFGDKVRIKDIFLRNGKCLADVFYPVGSIYISAASTSPADMFGGTWEAIRGRFLLGAGKNAANTTNYWGSTSAEEVDFPAGEMGGEYYHTLTLSEMPEHSHAPHDWSMVVNRGGYGMTADIGAQTVRGASTAIVPNIRATKNDDNNATHATGGGQPHNNMPPYVSVYMWQRIA